MIAETLQNENRRKRASKDLTTIFHKGEQIGPDHL